MKKRILFLNENPISKVYTRGSISGKELRLRSAIDEVDEVHVVCLPGKTVEYKDNRIGKLEKKIFVHQTIFCPYYLSPIVLWLYGAYYVWKLKPVIIEAESPILSGLAAILLGRIFNIPTLVEVRASYDLLIDFRLKWLPINLKRKLLELIEGWVFKHCKIIISNSKTYQKEIRKKGYKSLEINPGLQYPPLKIVKNNNSYLVIGYLGRLVEEKGLDILIRVVELLADELMVNKTKVIIVGEGKDKIRLVKRCLKNGLLVKGVVEFLPFTNNYEALAKFNILINPCLVNHPLEMVNAEAELMRIPVICFGDSKVPETVVDMVTGIKVKKKTVKALTKALKLLMTDAKLRMKMGDNGHKFVKTNYTFELQVDRLKKMYRDLKIF